MKFLSKTDFILKKMLKLKKHFCVFNSILAEKFKVIPTEVKSKGFALYLTNVTDLSQRQ
jgi:hypothetical protein